MSTETYPISHAEASRLVTEARLWVGTPYHHGQCLHGVGCDCLGLIVGALARMSLVDYRLLMHAIPRHLPEGFVRGFLEEYCDSLPLEEYETGDILLFSVMRVEQHVALYAGADMLIHCHMGLNRVVEESFDLGWQKRVTGAFRVRI